MKKYLPLVVMLALITMLLIANFVTAAANRKEMRVAFSCGYLAGQHHTMEQFNVTHGPYTKGCERYKGKR